MGRSRKLILKPRPPLGQFIYEERRKLGINLTQLSEQSGIGVSDLSRLESGERKNASEKTIDALAKFFNREVNVFNELIRMSDIEPILDFSSCPEKIFKNKDCKVSTCNESNTVVAPEVYYNVLSCNENEPVIKVFLRGFLNHSNCLLQIIAAMKLKILDSLNEETFLGAAYKKGLKSFV